MQRLALALAIVGMGIGTFILGQPSATAQQGVRVAQSLKVCRATNNSGRAVTWGCNSNQPCCFNEVRDEGYCGPVGGRC